MIKACIKQCEKIITNISEQLFNQLAQLGYKPLKAENYPVFQLYYCKMNEHYSAVLSFPSMVAWSSDIPTLNYKRTMIKLVKERPDITINEIIEELHLPIKKSRVSKILLEEKMY